VQQLEVLRLLQGEPKSSLKCLLTPTQGEHGGPCMAALLHFGASPNSGPFLTMREAAAAIAAAAV